MADTFKWTGVSSGLIGADYSAPSNWKDLTTGAEPATRAPAAQDDVVFGPVSDSTGIVSLLDNASAHDLTVQGGTTMTLFGGVNINTSDPSGPGQTTLDVQDATIGGGAGGAAVFSTYHAVVSVADTLTVRDATLVAQPTGTDGFTVGDPSYTPYAETHIGAAGKLVVESGGAADGLSDDGLVTIGAGSLVIETDGGVVSGLSGTGTVDVLGGSTSAAGTLDLSNASFYHTGSNEIASLVLHPGGQLSLGEQDIIISKDFVNDNAGVGNGYNARADVAADVVEVYPGVINGETIYGGQIIGNGAALALAGDAHAGSTANTYTLDLGSYHVGDVVTADFTVENAGPSSAAELRGAIQTATNGATINDPGLASGVTAENYGPIAGGASSAPYTVTLHADQSGVSTLGTLHIATDFDNVPGATLDIIGTGYNYADPAFELESDLGTLTHVGNKWVLNLGTLAEDSDVGTVDLALVNQAIGLADSIAGSFSESGSGFGITAGNFSGLAAGDAEQLPVTIDTSSAGKHTETLTLDATGSNPSGYSGALAAQTLTITDTVAANAAIPLADVTISQLATGQPPGTTQGGAPLTAAQLAGRVTTAPTTLDGTTYARVENLDAWNALKNAFVLPTDGVKKFGDNYLFANFVDTRADLAAAGTADLNVEVLAAKRGDLTLNAGHDTVTWVFQSNEPTYNNTATINAGGDYTTVTLQSMAYVQYDSGVQSLLPASDDAANGFNWSYDGDMSTAVVNLVGGHNTVEDESKADVQIQGGAGGYNEISAAGAVNRIAVGGDDNVLYGGTGDTTFALAAGAIEGDQIRDFHTGDTIEFDGFAANATMTSLGGGSWKISDASHNATFTVSNVTQLQQGTDWIIKTG